MEKEGGDKQDESKERWSEEKEGSRKEWTKIKTSTFNVPATLLSTSDPLSPFILTEPHTLDVTAYNLGGFSGGSDSKESASVQETGVWSLGWEDPLEKGMATHSSILTWRTRWTEEPGGLQSIGSQKSQTRLKRLSMYVYFRGNREEADWLSQ